MAEDRLTQAVLRKRAEHRKAEKGYRFFEESYKGGADYINSDNLYIHTFEDGEGFRERKERAYYYNYCAPIVNAYNSFIYRQKVTRDYGELDGNALFRRFLGNCDRQGNSYEEFVRNASKWSSVTGIQFILVDKPSETAGSMKEEIERGIYPYFVRVSPLNVWDWGLDRWGNLLWVKILETHGDEGEFGKESPAVQRFRVWYRDRWELYEVETAGGGRKAFKTEEGEHPVGDVPLVPVCHFAEEPMTGFSLLNDIAYVNRALFNWCSLLDEILYRQTFSQLVMPEDPKSPINDKALGTARGLGFPPDSKHAPHFISPDASQARALMDQIERGVEEIYRLATLRGAIGVKEESSGVARSYDFMITNNTLSNKALNMEEAETKALRFWAKWQGIEEPGHVVEYPSEFEVSSLGEEMENVLRARSLEISGRFEQIMKERIVKRMTPRLPREDMERVLAEIRGE